MNTKKLAIKLRRYTSIILLISGILTGISGIILYLYSTQYLYRLVGFTPGWLISDIHIYASFVAAGASIIHIYLNWRSLLNYFKIK